MMIHDVIELLRAEHRGEPVRSNGLAARLLAERLPMLALLDDFAITHRHLCRPQFSEFCGDEVIVGMQDNVRLINLICRNDSAVPPRKQFCMRCERRTASVVGRSRKSQARKNARCFIKFTALPRQSMACVVRYSLFI